MLIKKSEIIKKSKAVGRTEYLDTFALVKFVPESHEDNGESVRYKGVTIFPMRDSSGYRVIGLKIKSLGHGRAIKRSIKFNNDKLLNIPKMVSKIYEVAELKKERDKEKLINN